MTVGCAVSQSRIDASTCDAYVCGRKSASAFCSQRQCLDDTTRRTIAFGSEPSSVGPSSEEILRQFNNLCQQINVPCVLDQWPEEAVSDEILRAMGRCVANPCLFPVSTELLLTSSSQQILITPKTIISQETRWLAPSKVPLDPVGRLVSRSRRV